MIAQNAIKLTRKGGFSVSEKEIIAKAHWQRLYGRVDVDPTTQDDFVVHKKTGKWINLNPLKKLARRHVVSSGDMIKHYKAALTTKKWSEAKVLLEQRGSVADAHTQVGSPLTLMAIVDATRQRYNKFFGYAQNIFIGDGPENSAIQEELDPHHPEMFGPKLDEHVARIKRSWALDTTFQETRAEE